MVSGSSGNDDSNMRIQEEKENKLHENEAEKFSKNLLEVDEEWKKIYTEAHMYADELKQVIFEPDQEWNLWQKTKHYKIEVSVEACFSLTFM